MADNPLQSTIDNKDNKKKDTGYAFLIRNWCYRQLLGLFPLKGEPDEKKSPYNLLDYWTLIKKFLILRGRCVTLEVADDLIVAEVTSMVRNLAGKIKQMTIALGDERSSKLTFFTKLGKQTKEDTKSERNIKINRFVSRLSHDGSIIDEDIPFVYWQNNVDEISDLDLISPVLEDLDAIREGLAWNRKKSKKQIIISGSRISNSKAWDEIKKNIEEEFVYRIDSDSELNDSKKNVIIDNPASKQKDLWNDFFNNFDFLCRMIGLVYNDNKKKDLEMSIIKSQCNNYRESKKEKLEKGIRDWVEVFGGNYELVNSEIIEKTETTKEEKNDKE